MAVYVPFSGGGDKIVLFGSNVSVGFVVVSLSLGNPGLNKEIATYITLNLKKRVNHETVIDGLSSYPGILMIEEI